MEKLVFATNNKHKLEEIKDILRDKFRVSGLKECGIDEDIEETGVTLQENALIKARFVHDTLNENCFSDDTGLEIEALGGKPGVYSARYAGEPSDAKKNVELILEQMKGEENRKAQFRTIIVLIYRGEEYYFEGIIRGEIAKVCSGDNGFGYDPIFVPEGYDKSFAELSMDVKNKISHRALATEKLLEFLNRTK